LVYPGDWLLKAQEKTDLQDAKASRVNGWIDQDDDALNPARRAIARQSSLRQRICQGRIPGVRP